MTYKDLFRLTVIQWILFTLLKLWFFNDEVLANAGAQQVFYWVLVGIISAGLVRRFGVINFLECFFAILVWFLLDGFTDLVFTSIFTGFYIFGTLQYWGGYGVMAIVMFLAHKKYHLKRRHDLHHAAVHAAHAHGHDQHGKEHKH